MWKLLFVAVFGLFGLLGLSACDDGSSAADGDDPGNGDGKADDTAQTCVGEHNVWLLTEFAPLQCDEGATCIGRASLDSRPGCDGEPDFIAWQTAWDAHIHVPWRLRRNAAHDAFILPSSPAYLDRDLYTDTIALTDAEVTGHRALLELPHTHGSDAFDYEQWFGGYQTLLMDLAFPLYSTASVPLAGFGRELCGDPFDFEASGYICDHEPALYLSDSERQILALMVEAAPHTSDDGAVATWARGFFDLLTDRVYQDAMDFRFPAMSGRGLAGYELDFYLLVAEMRPAAIGDLDSAGWLRWFTLLLATRNMADSDEVQQLEIFAASRPATLAGQPAYALWLGTGPTDHPESFEDPAKLAWLIDVKPCARDTQELAELEALFDTWAASQSADVSARAAPALCE